MVDSASGRKRITELANGKTARRPRETFQPKSTQRLYRFHDVVFREQIGATAGFEQVLDYSGMFYENIRRNSRPPRDLVTAAIVWKTAGQILGLRGARPEKL
jgi:hypothetical protein